MVGMAPYVISFLMVVALSTNVIFAKSLIQEETLRAVLIGLGNRCLIMKYYDYGCNCPLYCHSICGAEPNHPVLAIFGMILLAAWTLMALVAALCGLG